MIYGREHERNVIEQLLQNARKGVSGILVLRGEAGVGKSKLLAHTADIADMRTLSAVGIESEAELPFAVLHQLLRPVHDQFDQLSTPQLQALQSAFGVGSSHGADRFLVGLAVLTVLSELVHDGPLLCLIDDAHWLDQATADALVFAARRLNAEGVVMIFAAREEGHRFQIPGIPELRLTGLPPAAAAELLAEHAPGLAVQVRDRIIQQSDGNPLALLELPRMLTDQQRAGQLSGLLPSLGMLPGISSVQREFRRRIDSLPQLTNALLVVAAADDTGDFDLVLRAGGALGAGLADLEPAERAGLLRIADTRVIFRHPLVRSAAYQNASIASRVAAHAALAAELNGSEHTERSVWHRALATTQPDEKVAAALDQVAERARYRSGYAAMSAAYERAAVLTPESSNRARRLVAAASAARDAGHLDRAVELAEHTAEFTGEPAIRAKLVSIRATLEFEHGSPRAAHA